MECWLQVDILPQPDDFTCGPTCLDAIYRYYGDGLELEQIIADVPQLVGGGTLAVYLACHALRRGYEATIYTYDLHIFDPTWFQLEPAELARRLQAQKSCKKSTKLHKASDAYLEFLTRGGKLRFEDLSTDLIRSYLDRATPILTGLSSTYLYRTAREFGPNCDQDDTRGDPSGHFVVLSGYDQAKRQVLVSDPLLTNPLSGKNKYWISSDRVIGAILLGIMTYDGNLLIIRPRANKERIHADSNRRQ